MVQLKKIAQRYLLSRDIFVIFGLQMALFLAVFVLPAAGIEGLRSLPYFDIVSSVLTSQGILINEFVEWLLPVGYKEGDVLLGILAIPVVHYLTAIIVAILGRFTYQFSQKQFSK